jgi:hypothetical protein
MQTIPTERSSGQVFPKFAKIKRWVEFFVAGLEVGRVAPSWPVVEIPSVTVNKDQRTITHYALS